MKESGKVVDLKGDRAYLLFNRTSMCAKCGACGMSAGQDSIVVTAKNALNAEIGSMVEIEFTAKNVLTSSMIAYIFPLLMLFVGVWLGYVIPQDFFAVKDVLAAILGLVFCASAFIVLKLFNPYFQKKFANVYTMVQINGSPGTHIERGEEEERREACDDEVEC